MACKVGIKNLELPTSKRNPGTRSSDDRNGRNSSSISYSGSCASSGDSSVNNTTTRNSTTARNSTNSSGGTNTTSRKCTRSSSSNSISNSNNSITTSKWGSCRKCSQQGASLVFLPCGHVVCCSECGLTVDTCLVCGRGIRGSIRTDLHEHI